MEENIDCSRCTKTVCASEHYMEGPDNCPTKIKAGVIEKAVKEYDKREIREFARQASIQEFENYMNMPEGPMSRNPRVEEVIQFAKKMGYRKLGIAFCGGLKTEAAMLAQILENRGFEVVSVSCKAGGIPKERIGIRDDQKIIYTFKGLGHWETMCSPISQAEILNDSLLSISLQNIINQYILEKGTDKRKLDFYPEFKYIDSLEVTFVFPEEYAIELINSEDMRIEISNQTGSYHLKASSNQNEIRVTSWFMINRDRIPVEEISEMDDLKKAFDRNKSSSLLVRYERQ